LRHSGDDLDLLVAVLEKVLSGSHVLIEDKENFDAIFLSTLPQELRCRFRAQC
jgi:hypothetical protein